MRSGVLIDQYSKRGLIAVGILMLTGWHTFAEIIPDDRVFNWSRENVGVPGGIPNRTTIYTTLSSGATVSQINSAISSCPSGQVVFLNAGTYNLTGAMRWNAKQNVTLRGAGMGQTILNFSSVASGGTVAIDSTQTGLGSSVNITSGYTKGSSNIVVSSTSGLSVGTIISITQNDKAGLVFKKDGQANHISFRAIIKAINGNTLTVWPPVAYTLEASLSPRCNAQNTASVAFCGIEDLTVNAGSGTTAMASLWWDGAYACWLKGVEFVYAGNSCIYISSSLACEIRKCKFRETASYQDGVGILLDNGYYRSGCNAFLIEDNIFHRVNNGVVFNGASGSVIAYNFATNMMSLQVNWLIPALNANHKPHGVMNLWEGNVGEGFQADGYHGSVSHQTVFRNWFHGSSTNATQYRKTIDLCRASYYFNVVGNVLGSTWSTNSSASYEMTGQPSYTAQPCIYRLGYPNMGNNSYDEGDNSIGLLGTYISSYPDTNVSFTLLRHGNYDFKNRAIIWDAGISDHTIPASLFCTDKPAYFGSLKWPPIDPANPGACSPTNLPSGYRFIYGVDPPGVSLLPPTALRVVTP
jgi:hypothetical protein